MKEIVGLIFVLLMLANIILVFVKARSLSGMKEGFEKQEVKDDLFHLLTSFLYDNISKNDYGRDYAESMKEQFPLYVEQYLPDLKRHTKKMKDLLDKSIVDFADERYTRMNLTEEYVSSKKFPALEAALEKVDENERLNNVFVLCQILAALDILAFTFLV